MNQNHNRYIKKTQLVCNDPFSNKSDVEIILFNRDENLRSHAVKHLTNTLEFQESWEKITSMNSNEIADVKDKLTGIGCPFFKNNMLTPPCLNDNKKRCHLFDNCTYDVKTLEDEYVRILEQIIEQGIKIPRYAFFDSTEDHRHFWSIPDLKIIAKAEMGKDKIYNLTTCFASSLKEKFNHFRDNQRRKT